MILVFNKIFSIGVSEYRLTESLPEQLKSSLPSIEVIEAELEGLK